MYSFYCCSLNIVGCVYWFNCKAWTWERTKRLLREGAEEGIYLSNSKLIINFTQHLLQEKNYICAEIIGRTNISCSVQIISQTESFKTDNIGEKQTSLTRRMRFPPEIRLNPILLVMCKMTNIKRNVSKPNDALCWLCLCR